MGAKRRIHCRLKVEELEPRIAPALVYQTLPWAGEDFSSGKPPDDDGWTYYSSNGAGRIAVVGGALRMDSSGGYVLNEAVLHMDLTGASNVQLSLDHLDSKDEKDPMPSRSVDWGSEHQNADGVAISDDDGATWRTVLTLGRDNSSATYTVDLDLAIAWAGMSYTSTFLIKFQQYDNQSWGVDGRQFDNIHVAEVTPGPINYTQNFSAGKPGDNDNWEYYSSDGNGRIQVVGGALRMDETGGTGSLNEAILHLNLSGQSGAYLQFDHRDNIDERDSLPNRDIDWATAHQNGDGVAISDDGGATWRTVMSFDSKDLGWTTYQIDLDGAIAWAGMSYTSNFLIKFQQYDNRWWGIDGREWDNITVNTTAPGSYSENFNDGKPTENDGWEYYSSSGNGRIEVIDGALRMDATGGDSDTLNEAIWHVNLSGKTGVQLQFDQRENKDERTAMPSGTWSGHQNGDGVAISDDGVNWYSVLSFTVDEESWTPHTIDLDAAIASAGMSYTANFQIKFEQVDNRWWIQGGSGIDGREFDNLVISWT